MTTRVTIRATDAPTQVKQGGLLAAMTGPYTHVAGGESSVEFETDDIEIGDAATSARWVEDLASVAAATFRQATTGEIVSTLTDEVPFPEAGDLHPFPEEEPTPTPQADAPKKGHKKRVDRAYELVQSVLNSSSLDDASPVTTIRIIQALTNEGLIR